MGSKFFWKQILFWRKFWGESFGAANLYWEQTFGEEIWESKIFGRNFLSKISFWEEKNTGKQKCFEEERYGEQIFWSKIYSGRKILASKIWPVKFF